MIEIPEQVEDKLSRFIYQMVNRTFIVFDFESNGFFPDASALSLSAQKILIHSKTDFEVLDKIDRFYYPKEGEQYQEQAIKVNGLNEDTINLRRGTQQATYPKLFKEDSYFYKMCKGCNSFVGHNLTYDLKGVPWLKPSEINIFDTMFDNIEVVKKPNQNGYKDYAWPKLLETIKHYGIPIDASKLHESFYDVEQTLAIFMEMIRISSIRILPEKKE
jgi:DNA polymerase III epsilon subunit-like protein